MNLKQLGLVGLLLGTSLTSNSQSGRFPKTSEIEEYVYSNSEKIIKEYSNFINDSIENFYFEVDDLEYYTDNSEGELGYYDHLSRGAVINNQEKYLSLEKKEFEKMKASASSNAFVKGVMIHELSHNYFNKLSERLLIDGIRVRREYIPQRGITMQSSTYGSEFIEEGFCEYIANKMGEIILFDSIPAPKNLEEFSKTKDTYPVKYAYSAYFLKDFFDRYGIKPGHRILVTNPPPNDNEILNPELFFKRLKDTRPLNQRVEYIVGPDNKAKTGK